MKRSTLHKLMASVIVFQLITNLDDSYSVLLDDCVFETKSSDLVENKTDSDIRLLNFEYSDRDKITLVN